MSEVSITDKTVGIGLPRLRRGAVGWRSQAPDKMPPVQSSNTSPQNLSFNV
jgi:hypothetical protein